MRESKIGVSQPVILRRVLLAAAVLALLALAFLWIDLTDPFCWHGYIASDGECAWE